MIEPVTPHPLSGGLPWHTWLGLGIMSASQVAYFLGVQLVATWLTPLMWTCYILAADGAVYRLMGRSWLVSRRREFFFMLLISVGGWLLFEVYDLRLQNWVYQGVPSNPALRDLAYFWSFATIMPGVFETSEIIASLLGRIWRRHEAKAIRASRSWPLVLLGAAMITIPPATPSGMAPYLFGFVWLGFFLLLDPINGLLGSQSLIAAWQGKDRRPMVALLIGGGICGLLWEAWNYQAFLAGGGHWIYTIPQSLRIFGWHYGKMPVLGLLGFPPFALELHAIYLTARAVLGGDRLWGRLPDTL
jgi:hypothetical protein